MINEELFLSDDERSFHDKLHHMQQTTCPHCGAPLDAHVEGDGSYPLQPSEGDFSVCYYCGGVCVFDAELKLARASAQDLDSFHRDQPDDFYSMIKFSEKIKARNQ